MVACTSAAATTTVASSGGGNIFTAIPGNIRHVIEQIVALIEAFIEFMQLLGRLGGGVGLFFFNPWIVGMRGAISFFQSLIRRIPNLEI
ncbi:hypothetical protein CBL_02394 [Carabus blaptoides fortunei]